MKPSLARTLPCLILVLLALSTAAGAADLSEEIKKLREENAELRSRVERLESREEEKGYRLGLLPGMIKLSGYADVEYIHTDRESDNDGFRLHHFSIFFAADIQPRWRFFSEVEYEDGPFIEARETTDEAAVVQGKLFVEQVYIQYHPGLLWDVKLGRFLTPLGLWNIFHYPPYVLTQRRPLFIRVLFPETSDGLQFRYSPQVGGAILDMQFFVANGTGNPGRLDRNENKAVGLRLNYPLDLFDGLELGLSYFRDKDNTDVTRNVYGTHLLFNFSGLQVQGEFVVRNNDSAEGRDFGDNGFYLQASYDIGNWTAGVRFDRLDEDDSTPDSEHLRYTAALNYHFAYNVVAKAEYNRNEFTDPTKDDFGEVIFSLAVALGDL